MGRHPYNPQIDVLLLCTANQCRSPMAEVLLRHHLDAAGADAVVSSAGHYDGGAPATGHGIDVMAARGLDLRSHTSRKADAAMLDQADLVIAMAREHVREAAVVSPSVLDRTFTLKELAGLAAAVGPRAPEEELADWIARVGQGRDRAALAQAGHDDRFDVADPVGKGRADYERTAELLDDLLQHVVALSFPAATRTRAAQS